MAAKLHGVVAQRRIALSLRLGLMARTGGRAGYAFPPRNRGQKRKKVTAITDEGCCLIYLKGETKPVWNKGNTP